MSEPEDEFDSVGEDGHEDKGYEDFGHYWNVKQDKLRQQSMRPSESNLFAGICIYVNGRTNPTQNALRDLVCAHGGSHEYVLDRSRVTHIIATVLPSGKILKLSESDVVVRPEWITESIKAGHRLDIAPFRLYAQLDPRQEGIRKHLSAADPSFLQSYYQASRLHHLSTWREELKKYASELMAHKQRPSTTGNRFIFHVDMDCFFASVSLIDHPELADKPVAIAHSTGTSSKETTSDVSSCNYAARAFGIHNGMSLGRAFALCPGLTVLPYDFEKYNAVAREFYQVLARWAIILQAISCDEAYLSIVAKDLFACEEHAEAIRKEINLLCHCNASIGISTNSLLARIATKKAKPDGIYILPESEASQKLQDLSVSDLPGVGWSLTERLESTFAVTNCGELAKIALDRLQQEFGPNIGRMLYERCRGIDSRPFPFVDSTKERKSVGTEVTWGVRLSNAEEAENFLRNLSEEVFKRFQELPQPLVANRLSLKVMIAKADAGSPRKHLGHGICDNVNRSKVTAGGITEKEQIFKTAWEMLQNISNRNWTAIRGIGIFLSDLRRPRVHAVSVVEMFNRHPKIELKGRLERQGYSIEVFQELPESVRQEILVELGLGGPIQAPGPPKTPPRINKTPLKNPPRKSMKAVSPSSQLTLTQLWKKRDDYCPDELPEGIDKDFLMALPSSLRQELIRDAREMQPRSPSKRPLLDANDDDNFGADLTQEPAIDLTERLPVSFDNLRTTDQILDRLSGDYDQSTLEAFLEGLIDFDCLEPLVRILNFIEERQPLLVKKMKKEYATRYERNLI